jgi:3-phenylpropionate/cinnamic acid dioxygenase small subunit
MNHDLRHAIEDFFYFEAELLDDRRLRDWLDLLTDDVHYWMPVRHKPGDVYYFNDTKDTLKVRVERVYAKNAWAEMPPSRTRHLVSNVRVKNDGGSEIEVQSNFLCYRTRLEKDQDLFVGTRHDLLRSTHGNFRIARRKIILDQANLAAKNISIFL